MYVYYTGFPLLILAAIVDASVLVQMRYASGQPSLLLLVIVSWALLNELSEALPWAVVGGIFADLLSVAPLGASSLALSVVVIVMNTLFGRVSRRSFVAPLAGVLVGTFLYQLLMMGMLILDGWSVAPLGGLLYWTLPSMVFNFFLVLGVFRVMGAVVEFFRPPSAPYF